MSTPSYKGPGQPSPSPSSGVPGWFGGLLGGSTSPTYKTTVTPVPTPVPCPPCPPVLPCPAKPTAPVQQALSTSCDGGDALSEPFLVDAYGDAVIPVGPGPITIVIQPRG